jgi:hypothetical protein
MSAGAVVAIMAAARAQRELLAGVSPAEAAAQARLAAAYESLAARAASLAPERLAERVPGLAYTVATMLDGVVEHGAYHGGQLALLRRTRAATTGFG